MRAFLLPAVLLACLAHAAFATTYVVAPDGSGDFPTIQAAIAAAVSGDVIDLTDGVFRGVGNRDIDFLGKAITVRSQSGQAADCTIDCEHLGRGVLFQNYETGTSVLEGVSITHGFTSGAYPLGGGGGILCYRAAPIVRDCIVSHCQAERGGGIWSHQSYPPRFVRCTLYANEALDVGGGFEAYQGAPILEQCTIIANTAVRGAGVSARAYAQLSISNTIVAFNEGGGSVYVGEDTGMAFTCSDIYGNGWGDWIGPIAAQFGVDGNISAHPLFCDLQSADFRLQASSPCAAENHPTCDRIGAWPVACTPIDYACCLGEACQVLGETECANLGGVWRPGETSCEPNPCAPSVYVVKPDGTGDFPTIQTALEAAEAGDVIELVDGTYVGEGNRDLDFLGKAVTLRSQSGDPEQCVIDCQASAADPHRGIHFRHYEGAATTVEGIAIVNGYAYAGAGVLCENHPVSPTLKNLLIAGCYASNGRGGGLAIAEGAGATVVGCRFRDNATQGHGGGGAACLTSAEVQFVDCEFKHNDGDRGGGVYCSDSHPSFLRCAFRANTSWEGGGGIWGQPEASPTIVDCIFEENETPGHGGALQCWSGSTLVTGSTFSGNRADSGGAVFIQLGSTDVELRACDFTENEAETGGAVAIQFAGLVEIRDCRFRANTAVNGGAIHVESTIDPRVLIADCTFSANEASGSGGAIRNVASEVLISGCTLADNRSPVGSGVRTQGEWCDLELDRTILAFGLEGEALSVHENTSAVLTCCDLFGNEGGDWVGSIAGQYGSNGNIAADPIFCRELHPPDPYMLRDDSPCAAENHPQCGQVGAWGVGCTQQGSAVSGPVAGGAWNLSVWPNVARGALRARIEVPLEASGAHVRLRVLDPAGRLVRELVRGPLAAGRHEVCWDGSAGGGPRMTGVFFLRLESGRQVEMRRAVVLR